MTFHPLVTLRGWRSFKPWRRHSLVLMVSGFAYTCIGVSFVYAEPSPTREVALQYALHYFSLTVWGVVFGMAGVITMLSARWPPVTRPWGYTLLTGLSVAWGLFYLAGIVFGNSPLTNISGAIVWSVFGFLWWAISGLIDPQDDLRYGQI